MIKRTLALLILLTILAACGASEAGSSDTTPSGTASEAANRVWLNDDYADALSVQGQLALGTVQLEETDLAVDEAQAAELLPLWQALQSLSNSDTTAQVELDAVVNQLQETMTEAQIEAISAMGLTTDSMTELIQSGELNLGGFGRRNNAEGEGAFGFPEGGGIVVPPEGFGGGPGGGLGRGQGGGVPGGFPGPGNLSEDDMATRQAQFASGDLNAFQDRALLGMVVRLLQTKTGDIPEGPGAGIPDTVFTVVGEATGLSMEEIRAQMAGGTTLADVITAGGGDVATVRTALIEALGALPNAADLDLEAIADSWLGE